MVYDLSDPFSVEQFKSRIALLMKRGSKVELTERKPRTLSQNNYLHLLFGWIGLQVGLSTEDVKSELFKKIVNRDFYVRKKVVEGVEIETLRSTADASVEELSVQIDRLRNWASQELGIYLPSANDATSLDYIDFEMRKYSRYL